MVRKAVTFVFIFFGLTIGIRALNSQAPLAPRIRDLMTPGEFQASGLNHLSENQLAELNSWFSNFVTTVQAESRNTTALPEKDFPALEGATIVAKDGQYLGKITNDEIDADSILNVVGAHGSTTSATSIFNERGTYGGTISAFSSFNPHASAPPKIFIRGKFVAYLSINEMKAPRVDPYTLVGWLKINE